MPLISVIVPVYKAELYLYRCLDSLLTQTFQEFEILLIDDGSPDKSGEMCDEYALKDTRIRVFHKENEGVSSARQWGTTHALGKYIIHVDPDDWVDSTMLAEMYSKAITSGADMVLCDYYENKGEKQIYRCQKPKSETPRSVLISLLLQELHGSCWNKLVKKECYTKHHISFPTNFNLSEDLYVNVMLCSRINSIAYLPKAFYHYDVGINTNSYTTSVSQERVKDRYSMICALDNDLVHKDEVTVALSVLKMDVCSTLLRKLPQIDRTPIYRSCQKLNIVIWGKLKTNVILKILLWWDYKGYDKLVDIMLVTLKFMRQRCCFNMQK